MQVENWFKRNQKMSENVAVSDDQLSFPSNNSSLSEEDSKLDDEEFKKAKFGFNSTDDGMTQNYIDDPQADDLNDEQQIYDNEEEEIEDFNE